MKNSKSIGHKIALLNRYSQTYFSESLKEYGIHGGGQIRIVITLAKKNQPVSQDFLATMLEVDKASISRMIRPLIRNGLIERTQDPQDKRAYLVKIADSVQEKIPFIIEKATAWSKILTDGMNEEDYLHLYTYLEVLEKNAHSFLTGEALEKKN